MDQPVFVVGCDRSGTTLLSLLLSKSPDLHMTLESGFIPELYKRKETYGNFNEAKQRWYFIRDLQSTNATTKTIAFDIFEITDDEAEKAIQQVAPTDYAGAINALFSKTAQKNGKPRWGNKTPKYVLHLDVLTNLFPESKIIHILRDPRDVAASIVKAGWTPTIKDAALYWRKRVQGGLESRSLGNKRYYEIKYEMLLEDPIEELKKICNWLNITFENELVSSYENDQNRVQNEHQDLHNLIGKPIDKSRAYAWKKNMGKADVAEIENINKDLIKKLDYKVTNRKVPITRKIMRTSYDFLLEMGKKLDLSAKKKL